MSIGERIQERFSASLVYGDPIEQDGVVTIPAAKVRGGGGWGTKPDSEEGAGFGISAVPAGAWVIRNGRARWRPAVDPVPIVVGGYVVAVSYFVATSWIERARARK